MYSVFFDLCISSTTKVWEQFRKKNIETNNYMRKLPIYFRNSGGKVICSYFYWCFAPVWFINNLKFVNNINFRILYKKEKVILFTSFYNRFNFIAFLAGSDLKFVRTVFHMML